MLTPINVKKLATVRIIGKLSLRIITFLKKARHRGLHWVFWRAKREILNPESPVLRKLFDIIISVPRRLREKWLKDNCSYIYGIYDLEICPITFNIIEFLCELEMEARQKNKKGFVVVFVPEKERRNFITGDYEKIVDRTSKNWRIDNILYQTAGLHPMCRGIHILPDRKSINHFLEKKEIFPSTYSQFTLRSHSTRRLYDHLTKPGILLGLKANGQGLKYFADYIRKNEISKKIVSITIRDYGYDTARNSNITEWQKFTDFLKNSNFHPLVIPDTDNAFGLNARFEPDYLFTDCCWNVQLRMALYETCFLNLCVLNGPGSLMIFNPSCNFIFMKTLGVGSITSNEKEVYKYTGYHAGEKMKFMGVRQVFSPLDDTFDNILFEFNAYMVKFYGREIKPI